MRFLADEDLNEDLVRAVLLRKPSLELVRVRDVGLAGATDDQVLAWAAIEDRLLLTHDASTMPAQAWGRVVRNEPMPGLIVISQRAPISAGVEDLLLLVEASDAAEWAGRVLFLPLK